MAILNFITNEGILILQARKCRQLEGPLKWQPGIGVLTPDPGHHGDPVVRHDASCDKIGPQG